jgi:hypothetical protein
MYITDLAAYCKVTDLSTKSTQYIDASFQDSSTFIDETGQTGLGPDEGAFKR